MDRFYRLASHLFGCLAFALALLAPLAVPQNGFADSGQDCRTACGTSCMERCGGDMTCASNCGAQCPGACCYTQSNGDPGLQATCCQSVCNGDSTCEANCNAATVAYTDWIWLCSNCDPSYRKNGYCAQMLCMCGGPGNTCLAGVATCSCK